MRFFWYFTPLFFLFVLIFLYYFPAVQRQAQPFLKIKELYVSSHLEANKQGDLQAKEFVSTDPSFSQIEAKRVCFSIEQNEDCWKARVGRLWHDSCNASTYLLDGVLFKKNKPYVCLQGSSFVWEENSLCFRSIGTNWVLLDWQDNIIRSRQFLWDQVTGQLSLSREVEGVMYVHQ